MLRTLLLGLLFLVGSMAVALAGAAALGVPAAEIRGMGFLLAGAGGGVGLLALFVVRPAVLGRLGGVRAQLVGAGLVGSLSLLAMLFAGARAMFVSPHDFRVVLTMILFALGVSVGFSLLCAWPLASRIERVRAGTARVAGGELGPEVPVEGHDEISGLAADFNRMARSLEDAAERERTLEEARRDLVAAVSHDLRTPLTSTRALVEALADGVAADPETESRYLDSARRELEHLSRLVEDLFELARIDAGIVQLTLEEASLGDLLSDTLSGFRPQAEKKGVRLVGEVRDGVDPVLADPPRLQRVLYNLLSNALRHTPPDGTVLVRAEPDDEVVHVEVADTGEGIAPEDLPRVFERSYRGDDARARDGEANGAVDSGAGLGLAIARGLVEAHGGSIRAENRSDGGARFSFTLQRT